MHRSGVFVLSSTPFSEKELGKDTATYLKLINELSASRWEAIHSALKTTAEIVDELRNLPKAEPLQNEAEEYRIRDSDPIDPTEEIDNLDLE